MNQYNCPNCQQATFSWRDKYLAGKWKILNCAHCGSRVSSKPIFLVLLYLFYLADVIDFGFMFYLTDNLLYIAVMLGGWLVLDYLSLYLPLVTLRRASPEKS